MGMSPKSGKNITSLGVLSSIEKMCMFGPQWRMNSGPTKLITGGFVILLGCTKPLEMSLVGPLFILDR